MIKLPQTANPSKYVGLYVIDFGEQCGVGYTAEEVATLLESEKFDKVKVYKIYRTAPDGSMELAGVSRERFGCESGMFFSCYDQSRARSDYEKLIKWSEQNAPPCRAKLQLSQKQNKQIIIALIYPAEYEQEIGCWLSDSGFTGEGAVDAGISQVSRYYGSNCEILERQQLWPIDSLRARDMQELLAGVGRVLQR